MQELPDYSMHKCAEVHNAMTALTKLHYQENEQHIEKEKSCVNRDNQDTNKFICWFDACNPFDHNDSLFSISSALTSKVGDGVNCDSVEEVCRLRNEQGNDVNVLAECSDNVSSYFEYELTPIPTSRFKDFFMRKSNLPILALFIITN